MHTNGAKITKIKTITKTTLRFVEQREGEEVKNEVKDREKEREREME